MPDPPSLFRDERMSEKWNLFTENINKPVWSMVSPLAVNDFHCTSKEIPHPLPS